MSWFEEELQDYLRAMFVPGMVEEELKQRFNQAKYHDKRNSGDLVLVSGLLGIRSVGTVPWYTACASKRPCKYPHYSAMVDCTNDCDIIQKLYIYCCRGIWKMNFGVHQDWSGLRRNEFSPFNLGLMCEHHSYGLTDPLPAVPEEAEWVVEATEEYRDLNRFDVIGAADIMPRSDDTFRDLLVMEKLSEIICARLVSIALPSHDKISWFDESMKDDTAQEELVRIQESAAYLAKLFSTSAS